MNSSFEADLLPHIQSEYSKQWEIILRLQDQDPKLREALVDIFDHAKRGVIVDVGCGQGNAMATLFSTVNAKYIGVDPARRTTKTHIEGAEFVEDDIVSFLQDRNRFQQFKTYSSRNFMFNGVDSIATSIPFNDLAEMLVFYQNPGDYIFGIYSPEMVDALRNMTDIYEEAYEYYPSKNHFFAFRMKRMQNKP